MKKTLFSVIALLVCVVAFAQNAGEYVYTKDSRVKILSGEELVTNGDFTDGTRGWTTDGKSSLSVDTFFVVSEAGPNGSNALVTLSKDNGPGTGSCLYQAIPVKSGRSYYVTYWVKTDETFTSIVTPASNTKNYQNVIFNQDGKLYSTNGLNILSSYGKVVTTEAGEWKQVSYVVTAPSTGYIAFYMYAPYIGQSFANFSIKEVKIVPDDRLANRYLTQLNSLINDNRWTQGKEEVQEIVTEINQAIVDDDLDSYNTLLNVVESEIIPTFLDKNTADISKLLDTPNFDSATPGQSALSKVGSWTIEWDTKQSSKSRWKTRQGDSNNETTYLACEIPGNYELPQSEVWQSIDLPKGKYMYTMQVAARRYLDKNNTKINEDANIQGLKVFIGKDSIECTALDTTIMHRYTVETELTEDGPIRLGFYQGTPSAHLIKLDLTELRAIDHTESELEAYVNNKTFISAKETLKQQIATATELLNSNEYIFAKSFLTDSIAKSQSVYDRYTEYSESNLDSVKTQTKRLQRACSYYKSQNAEYIALAKAISDGKATANDTSIKGDKTTLNNAILDGENYYNTLTTSSERDSLTLATKAEVINKEIVSLKASSMQADIMLQFYTWAQQDGATFEHSTKGEPIEISAGSNWTNVYQEGGTFAGNDISSNIAFRDGVTPKLTENGLAITSAKNNVLLSITGLKEGNEVTVDWKISNGSLYVASGNATYTKDDGTIGTPTATGKPENIKVTTNQITNANNDGINNTHRTVFIITKDGTLDFLCSSASTTTFAYIGINEKATPTAIKGIKDAKESQKTIKVVKDGRILIKTINGTFTVSGVQIK